MSSNKPIFQGISSLRKMAHIFILSGQLCQLFAFASGLVASSAGVGAMHVIAGMAYGTATFLLVFYWCLPEIQDNVSILYAVLGLCFGAALFIIIGMCVHGGNRGGTPYYSTMLICFAAFLAIGGGVCMILDIKGIQLKAPPPGPADTARGPAGPSGGQPKNEEPHYEDPMNEEPRYDSEPRKQKRKKNKDPENQV